MDLEDLEGKMEGKARGFVEDFVFERLRRRLGCERVVGGGG